VPWLGSAAAHLRQQMVDARVAARLYARRYGADPPDIAEWTWDPAAPTNP
jgi:xylulose-5-phosphate/fructose-6-phosphate phosphoketolase